MAGGSGRRRMRGPVLGVCMLLLIAGALLAGFVLIHLDTSVSHAYALDSDFVYKLEVSAAIFVGLLVIFVMAANAFAGQLPSKISLTGLQWDVAADIGSEARELIAELRADLDAQATFVQDRLAPRVEKLYIEVQDLWTTS